MPLQVLGTDPIDSLLGLPGVEVVLLTRNSAYTCRRNNK